MLAATYEPKTLRREIQQRGRLPVIECVEIGLALADALEHLHSNGLVHRDIKPSNIIFVDDVPKLADIGLVAHIDDAHSLVGTAGYIPPEGPGTPQADLYSLGKVLYEISLGKDRQDFPQLPPDLQSHPDHAALLELNEVLLKACETDFRKRYQTAQRMHDDLALLQRGESVRRMRAAQRRFALGRKLAVATAAVIALVALLPYVKLGKPQRNSVPLAEITSIAVLPFVNEGGWPPHEYLCDALTVETIDALTNCAGLRVAPRSAIFAFKRTTNDVQRLGQLGVRTVLAGSMKKSSNQLHIAARLFNVADGTELWSSNFDRQEAEIGTVQSEVVRQAAGALHLQLPEVALTRLEANLVHKLAAYQFYKQATTNMESAAANTQDGFYKTIELLNQTLVEDQGFGPAYANLADLYANAGLWLLPPNQAMNEARKNALRALQLDDSLPEAHVALGMVFLDHDLDPVNAKAQFRRAIEVAPRDGRNYGFYAFALSTLGRFDEADQVLKKGDRVDPKSHLLLAGWCLRYYYERDYTNLLRQAARLLTFYPNSPHGPWYQAKAHERLGRYSEALVLAQRLKNLDPSPKFVALLGLIHARMGHEAEADKALEELRVFAQGRRGTPIFDAQVLAGLGKNDLAIEKLKQAVEEYPPTAFVLKTDPFWDNLRNDPRFIALLKRVVLEK
jgi:TolB-like protein